MAAILTPEGREGRIAGECTDVAVAFALATAPPVARDRDGPADDGVEPRHSARATSSDQRSPRDRLEASSIFSGGIRRGSSFLKPPRNLGVGTKTVMPRRSASARSGRCGESGLTLMAVALFHGSMSRSRLAATSAPAKFGMRPCGGNGKRATPSAPSLSQTHCRAALLSANSPAIMENGAAPAGHSQGRNLLLKESECRAGDR
jgi:hypothetical protein